MRRGMSLVTEMWLAMLPHLHQSPLRCPVASANEGTRAAHGSTPGVIDVRLPQDQELIAMPGAIDGPFDRGR